MVTDIIDDISIENGEEPIKFFGKTMTEISQMQPEIERVSKLLGHPPVDYSKIILQKDMEKYVFEGFSKKPGYKFQCAPK